MRRISRPRRWATIGLAIISLLVGVSVRPSLLLGAPVDVEMFTGSPTMGYAPLAVRFSAPTAITYAWDFNNDNVIDSRLRNPPHT